MVVNRSINWHRIGVGVSLVIVGLVVALAVWERPQAHEVSLGTVGGFAFGALAVAGVYEMAAGLGYFVVFDSPRGLGRWLLSRTATAVVVIVLVFALVAIAHQQCFEGCAPIGPDSCDCSSIAQTL